VRAILLAAGFGTRLKPLTNVIPKCLVPINGIPLLGIWLERLGKAGVQELLVNTHYLASQVEDYIAASKYKNLVKIVNEPTLLGTAGTLLANIDFFNGEEGMLIHADNYCLEDLNAFQEAHLNRPKQCLITMMVFHTDDPMSCGIVEVDDAGIVNGFHEKILNPPGNLANGAIYILSTDFFKILPKEFSGCTCFSTEILPKMMGRIYAFKTTAVLLDIGSPESYIKSNKLNDH